MTLGKFSIIAIYSVAVIIALACSTSSLYVIAILYSFAGGAGLRFAVIPAIVNLLFLTLVVRIVASNAWRRHMYKPWVWLLVLLALPLIVYGNLLYVQSLRDI